MTERAELSPASDYPVTVAVRPALGERNRLTTFFRFLLAIPHLLLVGGPAAAIGPIGFGWDQGPWEISFGGGGLIGVFVAIMLVIAWFAVIITARMPDTLREIAEFYIRWRVRAVAYMMMLRDDYPPFGDADYPVTLALGEPAVERDRVTVFFRLLLVIPHALVLICLNLVWALTTAIAWVMILLTGRYPESLYGFAIGMLAWNTRVEAYMLLLRDEYPPFTLRA